MKTEKDSYDAFLEPIAVRFAQQIEWAIPLPMLLRLWVGKYIEGLPDAFSASCFIARNPDDQIAIRIRTSYKAAFGREYSILNGGHSRLHDERAKHPIVTACET